VFGSGFSITQLLITQSREGGTRSPSDRVILPLLFQQAIGIVGRLRLGRLNRSILPIAFCSGRTKLVDSLPFTLSLLVARLCHPDAMGNKNAPKREAKKPKKKKV